MELSEFYQMSFHSEDEGSISSEGSEVISDDGEGLDLPGVRFHVVTEDELRRMGIPMPYDLTGDNESIPDEESSSSSSDPLADVSDSLDSLLS